MPSKHPIWHRIRQMTNMSNYKMIKYVFIGLTTTPSVCASETVPLSRKRTGEATYLYRDMTPRIQLACMIHLLAVNAATLLFVARFKYSTLTRVFNIILILRSTHTHTHAHPPDSYHIFSLYRFQSEIPPCSYLLSPKTLCGEHYFVFIHCKIIPYPLWLRFLVPALSIHF